MSLSSHRDATTRRQIRPQYLAVFGQGQKPLLLAAFSAVQICSSGVQWSAVPFVADEPRRVRPLEAEVHLQAAVVGPAAVRPAALEAVDAEERRLVGRMLRLPPRRRGPPLPEPDRPLGRRRCSSRSARRPSRLDARDAHQPLPPPGRLLVADDLASEPDECRSLLLCRFRSSCCFAALLGLRSRRCCNSNMRAGRRKPGWFAAIPHLHVVFACQS